MGSGEKESDGVLSAPFLSVALPYADPSPGSRRPVSVSLVPGRRWQALDPHCVCLTEFGYPGDATPGTTLRRMFSRGLREGG